MTMRIAGLHHVTAIVDDPQANVDFYAGVLGQRLVKRTINFDDPGTYHLYFGDDLGRPGTLLTFFPWVGMRPGTRGSGQVSAIGLAVPPEALDYWLTRLERYGVRHSDPQPRFGEQVISLSDPAGLPLELVAQPDAAARPAWGGSAVPAAQNIRGMGSVTLTVARHEPTALMLTEVLGFAPTQQADNRYRYAGSDGGSGAIVDVLVRPDVPFGQVASGGVHHIAWRVPDDASQLAWRAQLEQAGVPVTEVRDRQYFHSIYFREPGGVLYEIATDTPGFAIDEEPDALGTALKLPPWLEERRTTIERTLPPLRLPTALPDTTQEDA